MESVRGSPLYVTLCNRNRTIADNLNVGNSPMFDEKIQLVQQRQSPALGSVLPALPKDAPQLDFSRWPSNGLSEDLRMQYGKDVQRALRVAALDPDLKGLLSNSKFQIHVDPLIANARYSFKESSDRWDFQVNPLFLQDKNRLAASLLFFLSAVRAGERLYGKQQPEKHSKFNRMEFGTLLDRLHTKSRREIARKLLESGVEEERELGRILDRSNRPLVPVTPPVPRPRKIA